MTQSGATCGGQSAYPGGVRMLPGLCTLLLLLAPSAGPAYADEIIVDDASPTVQVQGTWAVSSSSGRFFGAGYRYRVAGDGSSSVSWPFPATAAAGGYEVFVRWTSGSNRASNAPSYVDLLQARRDGAFS